MIYEYEHPENFSDWEKINYKEYNGNLILWGAGKVGGVAAHCLKKHGIKLIAFCDSSKEKWGTIFCGYPVISPEALKQEYPNAVVLISNSFPSSIYPWLEQNGFQKVLDCVSLFIKIEFDEYDFWMSPGFAIRSVQNYLRNILFYSKKKFFLERMLLIITTKCTLRCRNCDAYTPYNNLQEHYDANCIIDSCKKILDIVGGVHAVDVLGGEPLLHPDLQKILDYLQKENRIEKVNIISNGTLIPNNTLLEILKSPKFLMRISNYGKFSSKMEQIVPLLHRNKINCEITNYTYWDALPQLKETNETEEELTAKFKACTTNLFYVRDGKLFYCTVAVNLTALKQKSLPWAEDDYLDLYDESIQNDLSAHVLRFLNRLYEGKHINACKYCSGSHCLQFNDKVPVAEQANELLKLTKLY